jgi:glucokinase
VVSIAAEGSDVKGRTKDLALIADVGGTNVRFALARPGTNDILVPDSVAQFGVASFDSLAAAADHYVTDLGVRPSHAVLAVAGPTDGRSVVMTNSPWRISADGIAAALELEYATLVNDLAALTAGIPFLPAGALRTIGAREPPRLDGMLARVIAVIGPGTGLGVGVLIHRAGSTFVLDTEGGHVAFAPNTLEECEVLRLLAARFDRVSNERLISGPGLLNVYGALCTLAGSMPQHTTPTAIATAAAVGTDREAQRAIELFTEILGAVAGDLVMTYGAWDGVYVAGVLVTALLPWLEREPFRARFESKGRIAAAMSAVPTVAVVHEQAGLFGAAAIATRDRIRPLRWQEQPVFDYSGP